MLKDTITEYVDGGYISIAEWSQYTHGGRSIFEYWHTCRPERVPQKVKDTAEELYEAVMSQDNVPCNLVRTEINSGGLTYNEGGRGRSPRYGLAPAVGTILKWGVKSTSAYDSWVYDVARDDAPGINFIGRRNGRLLVRDGAEVIAYHIDGATRYLDISAHSDWDQAEALVAGSYEVIDIRREVYTTDIPTYDFVKITPRQYALLHNEQLEPFVSKRGEDMVRFGTHTYPASKMDDATVSTDEMIMGTVPIIHIYLRELDS